jgi:hypothetical protein
MDVEERARQPAAVAHDPDPPALFDDHDPRRVAGRRRHVQRHGERADLDQPHARGPLGGRRGREGRRARDERGRGRGEDGGDGRAAHAHRGAANR